ncbi:MAG TPA: M23 family metallopeptidase [Spirochaetota bacterium]|nr:M23 family metallopeptidase [Spirochaetota bacterium]HOL57125.1 M23 family metallopeptidase [Spirochaetota bacterium]HPP04680.1 M23 family metallopeptidase [Spirochaetota bacterium]
MKKLFTFTFLLSFLVLYSQEMTSDREDIIKNYIISSSFGDTRNDHFHTGIDLASNENEEIYSITDGRLIFYNTKKFRGISYGLGNFAVIQSEDNKYRITYSHLKENSLDIKKEKYKKNEKIANVGNTGHSTGPHLHLEIEDMQKNILINPLKFIKIKDRDKIPPIIEDVYFITTNREKISLFKDNKIKRGGKLFIKTMDRINSQQNMITPYKIYVLIGGKEATILIFDYFRKINNDYYVSTNDYKFQDIYQNGINFDYYLMDFTSLPGVVGFNIIVEDYNGNKNEFRRAVKVLPPDL